MNIRINKKNKEPAYLQLYRAFVKDITEGVYPYGSRLPSKRIIAEETAVSVITAEHALTLLMEEGYVETRERSGVFVIYRAEDFLSGSNTSDEMLPSVKVHQHKNGEFPFSLIAKTMRKVLLDYGDRILVKSPNHGCPELRNEISRYLGRSRGLKIRPSQVIVGSGAEYLYGLIVQLLGTKNTYALEKPSYNKIREVYEAMGAKCEMLTMTADGISSKELKKTKAKVLHVTPFNSYPTGVTAGISKKKEYLSWAGKNNAVIIEDNYDSELTVSRKLEDSLYSLRDGVDVIYLNTFSRTVAPSMRIGYMILPQSLEELFNKKLGFYSCPVPIFDQYVLAELIKNGDFERHLNRVRRKRRVDGESIS
ncbi:MAG: PLP-dependent aminotransferase family protein [Lachnospiraceae bacterium]|nr:PLP-dependent aminotransferase family protein [Lachnospiraceae bacterium]